MALLKFTVSAETKTEDAVGGARTYARGLLAVQVSRVNVWPARGADKYRGGAIGDAGND